MNAKIKAILSFYTIMLICLSISAGGVMLISYEYGLIYLSILVTTTPILAVISIIAYLKTMLRS
jgi:hypothetical protein